MRSTWIKTLTTMTAVMALPALVFAHAGHAGHEIPATVTPLPATGPDHLAAAGLVAGMIAARMLWRKLRQQAT